MSWILQEPKEIVDSIAIYKTLTRSPGDRNWLSRAGAGMESRVWDIMTSQLIPETKEKLQGHLHN